MKLYTFPSTREALKLELRNNSRLSSIWFRTIPANKSFINAPSTLPEDIKPRKQIELDVAKHTDATGLSLRWKKFFAYAKALMRFYKHGVSSVWSNYFKEYRGIKKNYMIGGNINERGVQQNIKIPSFNKLTQEMAQQLYNLQMEDEARAKQSQRQNNDVTVVKRSSANSSGSAPSSSPFGLTREQYQLIKRTPRDFYKLPTFAVIFLVFAETTPLVCYAFPEITPSTCVLPSILPRLWSPAAASELRKFNLQSLETTSLEELAHRTAYNLPLQEVKLLSRTLRLTSKYVPLFMIPETVLRRRIQSHYNYLRVDSSYLSANGNVWNLSRQELLNACLERNIILDVKEDSELFESEAYYNELRLKLSSWLIDFPDYNVGFIGLNHTVGDESFKGDAPKIMKWWGEDNAAALEEAATSGEAPMSK